MSARNVCKQCEETVLDFQHIVIQGYTEIHPTFDSFLESVAQGCTICSTLWHSKQNRPDFSEYKKLCGKTDTAVKMTLFPDGATHWFVSVPERGPSLFLAKLDVYAPEGR